MTSTAPTTDPLVLRSAFARVPQAVTAVAGLDDTGTPIGMTVSSFTPVSLDPPLVSVCIAATSTTWPRLRTLPDLGISVLAAHQADTCRALAARGDRFADLAWRRAGRSAVVLPDAVLTLHGPVVGDYPGGDHTIVLVRVAHIAADADGEPMVFHASTYRRLDTAPTP